MDKNLELDKDSIVGFRPTPYFLSLPWHADRGREVKKG
jgi:hypothetical protein